MKTVYILIGPKGSGKTYIGKLIEKELNIKFLDVEPYFLVFSEDYKNIKKNSFNESWKKIEIELSRQLEHIDKIIFESIGTFYSFKNFLKRLLKKYNVKLIKINTSLELSLKRIENRDNSNHVKMNKDIIKNINNIAIIEEYPYNLIIDNENSSDKKIVDKFKRIL